MLISKWLLVLLITSLLTPVLGRAAEFTIDPDHSSIMFKVKHLSLSTVTGKFAKFSGKFQFDEKNPNNSKVKVEIDPASVDTGVEARDNHLRSEAFFEVKTYPEAVFKSTGIEDWKDGKFNLKGNLTLHGVTKPVVLIAEFEGSLVDDDGKHHAAFTAETEINRQDYGIDFSESLDKGGLLAGNEVKLFFEVEGIQSSDMKK